MSVAQSAVQLTAVKGKEAWLVQVGCVDVRESGRTGAVELSIID